MKTPWEQKNARNTGPHWFLFLLLVGWESDAEQNGANPM